MGSVLVVNAGSTSLKLRLVAEDESCQAVDSLAAVRPEGVEAVAHRVVHGGPRLREPVVLEEPVRRELLSLEPLAPLHNRPALEGIDEARRLLPGVPHVAVFDTGFHTTIPERAALYAVPRRWRDWGVRRYGFHGLSVAWCAEHAPALLGRTPTGLRLVVCHLGGGSSVTAVRDGRSVDTTMGFSPLEGIPMTSRSGSVDPGALVYLLREHALDPETLDHALNFESGLRSLAGGSGDLLSIERAVAAGDAKAMLALDVYVHRLAGAVASMAVAAGGLDALVFTAGIGEGSAVVRARVAERLAFMGVELDSARNEVAEPDCDVAADGAPVRILIIRAREELVAARATRALLARLP